MTRPIAEKKLIAVANKVRQAVMSMPVDDIHTHLYDPGLGELLLWGIDDLLIYHYLVAETFRHTTMPFAEFWKLGKTGQADLIWNQLFIQHSPISESCRGVLTTLQLLGIDARKRDLNSIRKWFTKWNPESYTSHCMELAGVRSICMTNSPFDELERPKWENGFHRDTRFRAALRIDPLLLDWKHACQQLKTRGYKVTPTLNTKTFDEVRRFLSDWTKRLNVRYVMVSLPPDFVFPAKTEAAQLIESAVLPHAREFGIPFAVMPGVRRAVNPGLGLAGDGMDLCNLAFLRNLCAAYPENLFTATVLARENQHELCVLARKFRNLHIFGCWWFTNIPSIIEEMTRMRVELLGLSFTAQHSDARVLDQILYKWTHSREIIANVLAEAYWNLTSTGWNPSDIEIERDVRDLFGGGFDTFCAGGG